MQGRILKNQNGYFSVYGETGTLSLCRSRGRLKRETEILVGDFVEYETGAGSEATITRVFPRKNRLYRPPVSNIDTLVLTVAIRTPDVSRYVLDTMLLLAEDAEISPVVCINKCDLEPEAAENLAALYRRVGYPAFCTSTETGAGLSELEAALASGVIAFSGPSGVGKSSLLNRLLGRETCAAGSVSEKTGRGKNTTRHAELLPHKDAFFMDTPGYTSLSVDSVRPENVAYLFKEFRPYVGTCRFRNCHHLAEPDCRIRAAVEAGEVARSRYDSYCKILKEKKEKLL